MTTMVTGSGGKTTPYIKHGTNHDVAVNATSTAITGVFGPSTQIVRLVATEACHILIGSGVPTALITSPILPANRIEYVGVDPGDKIACIQLVGGAGTGVLSATEAA